MSIFLKNTVPNLPSLCCTAMYARISVQCNQCKLRYQKTSAVARRMVTVFNEVLMFSLPELPLEQCKISVSLYETIMTRKSTKRLIGQLTVGKEKSFEDKHWSLMMSSVRQPIAKWHGLLIWVTSHKAPLLHFLDARTYFYLTESCGACISGCWEICTCLTTGQAWTHLPPDSIMDLYVLRTVEWMPNRNRRLLSLFIHSYFFHYSFFSQSHHIERALWIWPLQLFSSL